MCSTDTSECICNFTVFEFFKFLTQINTVLLCTVQHTAYSYNSLPLTRHVHFQIIHNVGSILSPSNFSLSFSSNAQSLSVLKNLAQSCLSSIGLVLSAISIQQNSLGYVISAAQLKAQTALLTQVTNNIALALLSKKVPGKFAIFVSKCPR